jgi:hypothetical protein
MLRTVKFTSVYADDGDEISHTELVGVPDEILTVADDDEREELLRELLWPMTGTGREQGDACYWAESVDELEPYFEIEWC